MSDNNTKILMKEKIVWNVFLLVLINAYLEKLKLIFCNALTSAMWLEWIVSEMP